MARTSFVGGAQAHPNRTVEEGEGDGQFGSPAANLPPSLPPPSLPPTPAYQPPASHARSLSVEGESKALNLTFDGLTLN